MLHASGARISEALALTPARIDIAGRRVVFETLKRRKRGLYRAVPLSDEVIAPSTWFMSSQRLTGPKNRVFWIALFGASAEPRRGAFSPNLWTKPGSLKGRNERALKSEPLEK